MKTENETLSSRVDVVHTTAKEVISRQGWTRMDANAQKWILQLQSVQNECFSSSNVQIFDVLVAVGNLKNDNDNDLIEWKV